MIKRILNKLRNLYYSHKYNIPIKNKCYFGHRISICGNKYIIYGNNILFSDDIELCVIPAINGVCPQLFIGNNVHFGRMNRIGCANKIIIGNNVLFAPHVHISDRDHGFQDINSPISQQEITSKGPVIIGDETWLGFNCQIMSGVTIGKHCVIAAGTIVVKNVPDYCVVGGNPGRILKKYNLITKKWEKYDENKCN